METKSLISPYPWFGRKAQIADTVWQALGDVPNYIEPFYGGGAVHLARPHELTDSHVERINDADGFVSNFWRSVSWAPDEVAHWADWPVNENDLHARHIYLTNLRRDLTSRLEGDPNYFDAKIAGWWVWCMALWIGGGFASGKGPHQSINGRLGYVSKGANGIERTRPQLGSEGQGINRILPHLGSKGRGINRQLSSLSDYIWELHNRFLHVDVVCGDWSRLTSFAVTTSIGLTGVFLDPPYTHNLRDDVYSVDTLNVSQDVAEWAISVGGDPKMRIVLCGYEGEHDMPDDWRMIEWKTKGGYGSRSNQRGRENANKERLWLSPHCLLTEGEYGYQISLFG